MKKSVIRPTDDAARVLALDILRGSAYASLAVIDPQTGAPSVSRVALSLAPDGTPLTLISSLAFHTGALRQNPACSLLVGEPPAKGDPLAFPRLTVQAEAEFIARDADAEYRAAYRISHPKSRLYIDFADFGFVLFQVSGAALNGGFGKAYTLSAADLKLK